MDVSHRQSLAARVLGQYKHESEAEAKCLLRKQDVTMLFRVCSNEGPK